jgi:hypothetical protein
MIKAIVGSLFVLFAIAAFSNGNYPVFVIMAAFSYIVWKA